MEAKDTVMTHEETAKVLEANVPNYWSCTQREAEVIRQAQAEITWKAGIKEVVDSGELFHISAEAHKRGDLEALLVPWCWQNLPDSGEGVLIYLDRDKLKEWGITP